MPTDAYDALRRQLQSRLPILGAWRRACAIRSLVNDGSAQAVRLLAQAALWERPCEAADASFEALESLAAGQNVPAREALCRLVMHHEHFRANQVVRRAGYLPHDEQQRALFYFLTEQWEHYESLDFERKLLRQAYEVADPRLRRLIAAKARAGGRIEWVEAIAKGKNPKSSRQLSEEEWQTTIALIQKSAKWDDLWQLTLKTPPIWALKIVRKLEREGWKPAAGDRFIFQELLALADKWGEIDLAAAMLARQRLVGHKDNVRCLAVSPCGTRLATGSADCSIRLWNLPAGDLRHAEEAFHTDRIHQVAFGADGRSLVSIGRDGRIWVFDFASRTKHWINKQEGKAANQRYTEPLCLAVDPHGRFFATGHTDRCIYLWSLPGGVRICEMDAHEHHISCLAIDPDGELLASGSADGNIGIWSLPDGKLLRTLDGHHGLEQDGVVALAISPDSSLLATCGIDNRIRLFTFPGGKLLHEIEGYSITRALAFTLDGKLLIAAGGDRALRLYDPSSGAMARSILDHPSEGACMALSPDGGFLALACEGGYDSGRAVHLISLADGKLSRSLLGHEGLVCCLAFSPDGGLLFSGSDDRTVRIWSAELDRLARLPIDKTTLQDLQWIQKALQGHRLAPEERGVLEFVAALMRRTRRSDILLEDTAPRVVDPDVYDIQIEG